MGQDQDDTIYIPVTTAQKKLFGTAFPGMVRLIMVRAKGMEDLYTAEKQITELLRQKHRIGQKQGDDFTAWSNCIRFSPCWRNRDNEYNARLGYRKDKGDRHTNGSR